jgi:hypothetical protein
MASCATGCATVGGLRNASRRSLARYYNPAQGSWTQEDPLNQISDFTQNDRYGFDADDAPNETDPNGTGVGGCYLMHTRKYCKIHAPGEYEPPYSPPENSTCHAFGFLGIVAGAVALTPLAPTDLLIPIFLATSGATVGCGGIS